MHTVNWIGLFGYLVCVAMMAYAMRKLTVELECAREENRNLRHQVAQLRAIRTALLLHPDDLPSQIAAAAGLVNAYPYTNEMYPIPPEVFDGQHP